MNRPLRPLRWLPLALLLTSAPGCLAAAAAVGAGGAIAWTQRGASSSVPGTVDQVYGRAEAVFRDMGITQTGQSSADQGAERSLRGTREDMEVTVEIERESASTARVEVYARRNTVEFDRGYARDVLTRIVNRS